MASKRTKCIKSVGAIKNASQDLQSCENPPTNGSHNSQGNSTTNSCIHCRGTLIKYGYTRNKKQRYQCKLCKKTQVKNYHSNAYLPTINQQIIEHLKEGCGIRSISRLLRISTTTVIRKIIAISGPLKPPYFVKGKEYEMDEIRTYIGKKTRQIWIAYAIQKDTKEVVDFRVGRRTNRTLKGVLKTLFFAEAKKISTDKLNSYRSLIDGKVHCTKYKGTNYIERKHLTLRTHLKRLNRKTICFSRSAAMLTACLKIYFWT